MRANRIDLNKPKQLQQIALISRRIKCRQFLPQQQQQQRRLRKLVENCLIIELNWRAKPVRDGLSRFWKSLWSSRLFFLLYFRSLLPCFEIWLQLVRGAHAVGNSRRSAPSGWQWKLLRRPRALSIKVASKLTLWLNAIWEKMQKCLKSLIWYPRKLLTHSMYALYRKCPLKRSHRYFTV